MSSPWVLARPQQHHWRASRHRPDQRPGPPADATASRYGVYRNIAADSSTRTALKGAQSFTSSILLQLFRQTCRRPTTSSASTQTTTRPTFGTCRCGAVAVLHQQLSRAPSVNRRPHTALAILRAQANSLAYNSFNIPIFRAVTQMDINAVTAGADANAAGGFATYPMHAVELDAFMFATSDSATCLRRGALACASGRAARWRWSHSLQYSRPCALRL